MKEFQHATAAAKDLASHLGRGWKPEVWENLGWHYRVNNGRATVRPRFRYGGEGRRVIGYSCVLHLGGAIESGSLQYVTQWFGSGTSPRGAIRQAVAKADKYLRQLNSDFDKVKPLAT